MKNKNSFTKQQFLQLQYSCCPFCESDGEDIVQWHDKKTKISHFTCLNCDYYLEERFVEIKWAVVKEEIEQSHKDYAEGRIRTFEEFLKEKESMGED